MQLKKLSLLQEKINELRTALFFCENQDDLPYATYLVEVLRLDDEGRILFYINKHSGQVVEKGEHFPVRLEFYRKGISYTIDVKGMATVEENINGNGLLVSVDVEKLRYNEFIAPASTPPLETIGKVFKNIFDIPGPLDRYVYAD